MQNWKCEALDIKLGNECTLVLVKNIQTSKKSVIVIGKPGELKDLPVRQRFFTQKVESFFFEFEEKFELLDFMPTQYEGGSDDLNKTNGYFIVKQKQSYGGHPTIRVKISEDILSTKNQDEV